MPAQPRDRVTECRLADDRWPMVAVAPEGMTTNGKQLLHFRTGAFVAAAPVLPVCVSYSWKRLNPAWTLCSEPWHIARMLTQFVNVMNVEVLPSVTPTEAEAAQPSLYAENVRKLMVRHCSSHRAMCVCCDQRAGAPVVLCVTTKTRQLCCVWQRWRAA